MTNVLCTVLLAVNCNTVHYNGTTFVDTVFGNIYYDQLCLNRWDEVGLLDEHTCICLMLLNEAGSSSAHTVTTGIELATLILSIKWCR